MSRQAFALLHPAVQHAVWKMGWRELKPVQTKAFHAICQTPDHLVICAPTAGGKTEAAFLPIISRLLEKPMPSIQALYISPLKALINDQFTRLEALCGELGISVHRWHGDVSEHQKKTLRDQPAGILLITPESLESNFINFGAQVPGIYRHLDFVVIDELHTFINNVRGVHLRSLLTRLTITARCAPRMVGLSATLSDFMPARAFLSPDAIKQVQVIEDSSSRREIKLVIKSFLSLPSGGQSFGRRLTPQEALWIADQVASGKLDWAKISPMFLAASRDAQATPSPSATDELDDIANDILKHLSQSTNLIFGNSKNSIELLASKLHALVQRQQWPVDPFGVHHASLSKDLREEAECSLKSGKPATVLCSSTMELGIDIGYVRAVGQLDPPASVASLVQRLGRSGRRLGEPAVLRLYVRLESPHPKSSLSNLLYPKLLQSIALVELLLARWLEPFDQERMHLSTLVHQILSCLKQTGGMRPINIYQTLCQNGPFRNVHQKQFATLLRELAKNDLIAQLSNGDLILSLRGERITASADFYAAFQSKEEYTVSWGNQEVGKLPADIIPPPGESLILAGRRWQVKEVIPEQQLVFVLPAPHGRAPLFAGEMGEIHSRVAQEMKTILLRDDEPVYLDPASKLLLRAARRVAHSAGLAERDFVIDNHTIQWFPWVGTRTLKTISLLAKSHNIPHITDHISIIYKTSSLELFRNHLQQIASKDINPLELARLLPVKAVDKFDCFLPSSLLDEANARDRLSLSEAREASAACLSCLS